MYWKEARTRDERLIHENLEGSWVGFVLFLSPKFKSAYGDKSSKYIHQLIQGYSLHGEAVNNASHVQKLFRE